MDTPNLHSFQVNPVEVIFLCIFLTLFGVSGYYLVGNLEHYTPLALVPMSSSPISEGEGATASAGRRISASHLAPLAGEFDSDSKAEFEGGGLNHSQSHQFDVLSILPACTNSF